MSEILKELRALSEDKLIELHDKRAAHTEVGVNHYLVELARRDFERQAEAMHKYTQWVACMTGAMLLFTAVSAVAVLISSCSGQ